MSFSNFYRRFLLAVDTLEDPQLTAFVNRQSVAVEALVRAAYEKKTAAAQSSRADRRKQRKAERAEKRAAYLAGESGLPVDVARVAAAPVGWSFLETLGPARIFSRMGTQPEQRESAEALRSAVANVPGWDAAVLENWGREGMVHLGFYVAVYPEGSAAVAQDALSEALPDRAVQTWAGSTFGRAPDPVKDLQEAQPETPKHVYLEPAVLDRMRPERRERWDGKLRVLGTTPGMGGVTSTVVDNGMGEEMTLLPTQYTETPPAAAESSNVIEFPGPRPATHHQGTPKRISGRGRSAVWGTLIPDGDVQVGDTVTTTTRRGVTFDGTVTEIVRENSKGTLVRHDGSPDREKIRETAARAREEKAESAKLPAANTVFADEFEAGETVYPIPALLERYPLKNWRGPLRVVGPYGAGDSLYELVVQNEMGAQQAIPAAHLQRTPPEEPETSDTSPAPNRPPSFPNMTPAEVLKPKAGGQEIIPKGVKREPIEGDPQQGDYVWRFVSGYNPQDMILEYITADGLRPGSDAFRFERRKAERVAKTRKGFRGGRRAIDPSLGDLSELSRMSPAQIAVYRDELLDRGLTDVNGLPMGFRRSNDGEIVPWALTGLPATPGKLTGGRRGKSIAGPLTRFITDIFKFPEPRRVLVRTGGQLFDVTAPGQVYIPQTQLRKQPSGDALLIQKEGSTYTISVDGTVIGGSYTTALGDRVFALAPKRVPGGGGVWTADEKVPAADFTRTNIAKFGRRLVEKYVDVPEESHETWFQDGRKAPVEIGNGTSKKGPSGGRSGKVRKLIRFYRHIEPEKLRKAADKLQKQIDDYRTPPDWNMTPRRARMQAGNEQAADRLERLQTAMRALAWGVETQWVTMPDSLLSRASTRKGIELLLRGIDRRDTMVSERQVKRILDAGGNGKLLRQIRSWWTRSRVGYLNVAVAVQMSKVNDQGKRATDEFLTMCRLGFPPLEGPFGDELKARLGNFSDEARENTLRYGGGRTSVSLFQSASTHLDQVTREYVKAQGRRERADDTERQVKAAERGLIGSKIAGFFPTPSSLADRMVRTAGVEPGDLVLEPSAGTGQIADAVRRLVPGATVAVAEVAPRLREILEIKGYNLIARDMMEIDAREQFDKILMNPPFERGQDIEHVIYAYESLLEPGGTLVSVMSAGPFFRSSKKDQAFRAWLDENEGTAEELPADTFKASPVGKRLGITTGVQTYLVTLEK